MLAAFLLGFGLAACPAEPQINSQPPSCYVTLAATRAESDARAAAAMISSFRRSYGLGPVTIDPELMQFAQSYARIMAAHNQLGHDVGASFHERRRALRARVAAENVAAGYHTVADVFAGWRDSLGHRANMLDPEMTRIGIGSARASGSYYEMYWALVLTSSGKRSR